MFPCDGAGRIGNDVGVSNRRISLGHDQADVKGRFIGRLIERGKGAARVGGLKLGHGIISLGGAGKIEAAQLSVQNAAVRDFQGDGPGGQLASK